MPEVVSNKIITFGGMIIAEGKPQLDQWGKIRADRVLKHYFDHQDRFRDAGAWILCAGGWPLLGRGMEKPPKNAREGRMTARYLHANGIPARWLNDEDIDP